LSNNNNPLTIEKRWLSTRFDTEAIVESIGAKLLPFLDYQNTPRETLAALQKRYAPTNLQETMKWENKYHSLLKVRKNTNLELWFDEWEAAIPYFRRYKLSQIVSNTRGVTFTNQEFIRVNKSSCSRRGQWRSAGRLLMQVQ
jgi:hypothetical protein